MDMRQNLEDLRRYSQTGYWSVRLFAELDFLQQVIERERHNNDDCTFDEVIQKIGIDFLKQGAITQQTVEYAESALRLYSTRCKEYELLCIGHAHIDMNWLWGFHETVMITIDTFQTVLDLFEKYPQFKFSQSQASVYQIVEKYAPQLVEPIRLRIAEGRWEVTASQWVESDMNLPSGESLVRQLSYARRYLTDRFGAPESAFHQVFLPDTFGYGASTPELFASAGIERLYHCRGSDDYHLYRWTASSGRSVLVYRDPRWYNTEIDASIARFLPEYYSATGVKSALCLYGVGDHGGGPTMRDIERLVDMDGWPIFPQVKFSTLHESFNRIEEQNPRLPEVRSERNPIFTGCYTSQSRIKMANRKSQELLYEAEYFDTIHFIQKGTSPFDDRLQMNLRDAWVNVLFGQFHDILPGSGIRSTREHALGRFQETAAAALSAISFFLRDMTTPPELIENSNKPENPTSGWCDWNTAHGAGVGFQVQEFRFPSTGRGTETKRLYRVFNTLQWDRKEVCEVTVWDWPGSPEDISCVDEDSKALLFQILEIGKDPYWGHRFIRLAVFLKIPAFGVASLTVLRREISMPAKSAFFPYGTDNWLVERSTAPILENDRIRVVFDPRTLTILSFTRKSDGIEAIPEKIQTSGGYAGVFRLVREDTHGMTAWIVGRHTLETPLVEGVRLTGAHIDPEAVQQWLEFEIPISRQPATISNSASRLKVRISLNTSASMIGYTVICDWLETGSETSGVPQLDFYLPLQNPGKAIRSDIPFGIIDRTLLDMDIPAIRFGARTFGKAGALIQIATDSKQAFRMTKDGITVTLLRSSIDPDPYPELGRHRFSFSLSLLDIVAWNNPVALFREALEFNHPSIVYPILSKSTKSADGSFIRVEGEGVVVSSIKRPEAKSWDAEEMEKDKSIIVRLCEVRGIDSEVSVSIPGRRIKECIMIDIHEWPIEDQEGIAVHDGQAFVPVPHFGIQTIRIEFD